MLDLRGNNIGPSGAEAIAEALKVNRVLTSCDLSRNIIGVEGAKALASALWRSTSGADQVGLAHQRAEWEDQATLEQYCS